MAVVSDVTGVNGDNEDGYIGVSENRPHHVTVPVVSQIHIPGSTVTPHASYGGPTSSSSNPDYGGQGGSGSSAGNTGSHHTPSSTSNPDYGGQGGSGHSAGSGGSNGGNGGGNYGHQGHGPNPQPYIAAADNNHDGHLTSQEILASGIDTNGDGRITRHEEKWNQYYTEGADANKDGRVSNREAVAYIKAADSNNDGRLSISEMTTSSGGSNGNSEPGNGNGSEHQQSATVDGSNSSHNSQHNNGGGVGANSSQNTQQNHASGGGAEAGDNPQQNEAGGGGAAPGYKYQLNHANGATPFRRFANVFGEANAENMLHKAVNSLPNNMVREHGSGANYWIEVKDKNGNWVSGTDQVVRVLANSPAISGGSGTGNNQNESPATPIDSTPDDGAGPVGNIDPAAGGGVTPGVSSSTTSPDGSNAGDFAGIKAKYEQALADWRAADDARDKVRTKLDAAEAKLATLNPGNEAYAEALKKVEAVKVELEPFREDAQKQKAEKDTAQTAFDSADGARDAVRTQLDAAKDDFEKFKQNHPNGDGSKWRELEGKVNDLQATVTDLDGKISATTSEFNNAKESWRVNYDVPRDNAKAARDNAQDALSKFRAEHPHADGPTAQRLEAEATNTEAEFQRLKTEAQQHHDSEVETVKARLNELVDRRSNKGSALENARNEFNQFATEHPNANGARYQELEAKVTALETQIAPLRTAAQTAKETLEREENEWKIADKKRDTVREKLDAAQANLDKIGKDNPAYIQTQKEIDKLKEELAPLREKAQAANAAYKTSETEYNAAMAQMQNTQGGGDTTNPSDAATAALVGGVQNPEDTGHANTDSFDQDEIISDEKDPSVAVSGGTELSINIDHNNGSGYESGHANTDQFNPERNGSITNSTEQIASAVGVGYANTDQFNPEGVAQEAVYTSLTNAQGSYVYNRFAEVFGEENAMNKIYEAVDKMPAGSVQEQGERGSDTYWVKVKADDGSWTGDTGVVTEKLATALQSSATEPNPSLASIEQSGTTAQSLATAQVTEQQEPESADKLKSALAFQVEDFKNRLVNNGDQSLNYLANNPGGTGGDSTVSEQTQALAFPPPQPGARNS